MAPYNVPLLQVADRFGTSKERIEILKGLIAYRDELRTAGFLNGFQWLDGSFMENVEKNRSRPPGDIDVVTFSHRPVNCMKEADWDAFCDSRPELFDSQENKIKYFCDAYFVDLSFGNSAYLVP